MKKIFFSIFVMLFANLVSAQSTISTIQTQLSLTQVKSLGNDEYIMTGNPGSPSITLSLPLCSSGSFEVNSTIIGKYNAATNCWQWIVPSVQRISFRHFDVDNNGNVFVTGSFDSTVTFPGNITKTSLGGSDMYVMKIDAQGNVVAVVTDGSAEIDRPHGIKVDVSGNVCISGMFNFDLTHASQVNGATVSSIYVAKYNNNLARLWRNNYQGYASSNFSLETHGTDITIDNSGNVYQTGVHCSNITFTKSIKITLSGSNSQAGFIVKYNSNGVPQWARTAGRYSRGTHVIHDGAGNVYMGGNFWNSTINFGNNVTLTQSPSYSGNWSAGYMAKYNSSGTAQWARKMGGSVGGVNGFVFTSDNNISALGNAHVNSDSLVRVDGMASFPLSGTRNFVIATYTPTGNLNSVFMPVVTGYNPQNNNYKGEIFTLGIAPIYDGYMIFSRIYSNCGSCWSTVTFDNANVVTASNGVAVNLMVLFQTSAPTTVKRVISEPAPNIMKVYPNPASNYLTIRRANNTLLGSVLIFDGAGKIVYKKTTGDSNLTINVKSFSAGVYYLKIGQQEASIKFVKE